MSTIWLYRNDPTETTFPLENEVIIVRWSLRIDPLAQGRELAELALRRNRVPKEEKKIQPQKYSKTPLPWSTRNGYYYPFTNLNDILNKYNNIQRTHLSRNPTTLMAKTRCLDTTIVENKSLFYLSVRVAALSLEN